MRRACILVASARQGKTIGLGDAYDPHTAAREFPIGARSTRRPPGARVAAPGPRCWRSFRLIACAASLHRRNRSAEMSTYCDVAPGHEWHGPYHEHEYGFPLTSDAELLERLALEINQAGLSWLTILKKRDAFRRTFDGFDVD